ncbi:hypothetical protein PAMP_024031 [Pampus punctatissimus]
MNIKDTELRDVCYMIQESHHSSSSEHVQKVKKTETNTGAHSNSAVSHFQPSQQLVDQLTDVPQCKSCCLDHFCRDNRPGCSDDVGRGRLNGKC